MNWETATTDSMDCKNMNDWVLEQIQPHMSLLNIIEQGKLKARKTETMSGASAWKWLSENNCVNTGIIKHAHICITVQTEKLKLKV